MVEIVKDKEIVKSHDLHGMRMDIKQEALNYHRLGKSGKIEIQATKSTFTQEDLSLAYTPGVAHPVLEIASNPEDANLYTNKANLVAVVSDGSAVLGLGNVGALASKPVMEGKAVLFKKFADVDVFDLEVKRDSSSIEHFVSVVEACSPTFGGINLEDIKAPECFAIEEALMQKLNIPVFHDDQHGTAIVVAAALLNALELAKKNLATAKIVCLGAGAAGIATINLLKHLGAQAENIYLLDRRGVIYKDRDNTNKYKLSCANETNARTLDDAIVDADVFIGVAGENLLKSSMLLKMAKDAIVFALSNPNPEIYPQEAFAARKDIIMATGRSDFPNQVNNVLCFPYIFRGALDVRAHCINREMQIAAVNAIRNLAKEDIDPSLTKVYANIEQLSFGKNYLLPKPFDPRLKQHVSAAVAHAAVKSGVSQLVYPDKYQQFLPL